MRQFYFADSDGATKGPVSEQDLEQWRQERRLEDTTWVLEVGTDKWAPLSSLRALTIPPPPPNVIRSPVPSAPGALDETLHSDSSVLVTTARLVLFGTTYPVRNITSVRATISPTDQGPAVSLLIFGALITIAGFVCISSLGSSSLWIVLLGIVAVTLAILWMRRGKAAYHIFITTSAGEIQAMKTFNKQYLQTVLSSINTAIARYR